MRAQLQHSMRKCLCGQGNRCIDQVKAFEAKAKLCKAVQGYVTNQGVV